MDIYNTGLHNAQTHIAGLAVPAFPFDYPFRTPPADIRRLVFLHAAIHRAATFDISSAPGPGRNASNALIVFGLFSRLVKFQEYLLHVLQGTEGQQATGLDRIVSDLQLVYNRFYLDEQAGVHNMAESLRACLVWATASKGFNGLGEYFMKFHGTRVDLDLVDIATDKDLAVSVEEVETSDEGMNASGTQSSADHDMGWDGDDESEMDPYLDIDEERDIVDSSEDSADDEEEEMDCDTSSEGSDATGSDDQSHDGNEEKEGVEGMQTDDSMGEAEQTDGEITDDERLYPVSHHPSIQDTGRQRACVAALTQERVNRLVHRRADWYRQCRLKRSWEWWAQLEVRLKSRVKEWERTDRGRRRLAHEVPYVDQRATYARYQNARFVNEGIDVWSHRTRGLEEWAERVAQKIKHDPRHSSRLAESLRAQRFQQLKARLSKEGSGSSTVLREMIPPPKNELESSPSVSPPSNYVDPHPTHVSTPVQYVAAETPEELPPNMDIDMDNSESSQSVVPRSPRRSKRVAARNAREVEAIAEDNTRRRKGVRA